MTGPEILPGAALAAVEAHMGGPFVWGSEDCCSGPCTTFAALHGIDPMASIRADYAGPVSAVRLIRQAGGLWRLARHLAREAGLVSVAPEVAPAGAIGLVRNGFAQSLAICLGPRGWAAKTERGFVILAEAEAAWRV